MPSIDRSLIAAVVPLVLAARAGAAEDPGVSAPPESAGQAAEGAPSPIDTDAMSLEDLLNVNVEVASRTAKSLRQTPGVVTVIKREEILNSGARDLIDVLRLVPGFDFGTDVQLQVGIGFRGLWAQEGKAVVLLDGQELTESLYLTSQFGMHVMVHEIERIEIMRGPGSVIYGGYAELAVINIVTRSGGDLRGARAYLHYGQMARGYSHRVVGLAAGDVLDNGLEVSAAASVGQGHRSDRYYRDFAGDRYLLTDNGATDPTWLNLHAAYKGLAARFIYDGYSTTDRSAYDASLPEAVRVDFPALMGELRYDLKLGDGKLSVSPRLQVKRQHPWRVLDQDSPVYIDKTVDRYHADLIVSYDPLPGLNLLAGASGIIDRAMVNGVADLAQNYLYDGKRDVQYETIAAFAQVLYDSLVNLSAGARYEHHSKAGSAFVPRFGITKVIDRFHVKLLGSYAFKPPGIENLVLNPDLTPERARTVELEAGYRILDSGFLVVSAFDIFIDGPIIYLYDPVTDTQSYENYNSTGSRGLELTYRWVSGPNYATATYSYYMAPDNRVDQYTVPTIDHALLGFSQHKANVNASFELRHNFSINPSVLFYGPRYGYFVAGTSGSGALKVQKRRVLVNLFLRYRDLLTPGLEVGVGVFNALDERMSFLQPYDGGHAPVPDRSRDLMVRLSYALPFD